MEFVETDKNIITISKYKDCFIYFLLNDGDVVYVGQTQNGIVRPLSHRDKKYDEIKILYCNVNELNLLEDKYIQKYKPIYNKQSNFVIRWSLLRVRNHIRQETTFTNFTIPQLKKVLRELNIRTEKDYFNGKETISFNDYAKVIKHIKRKEKQE